MAETNTRPEIDPGLCTGCGICVELCPEVFQDDGAGFCYVADYDDQQGDQDFQEAVDACPEGAITLAEEAEEPSLPI